MSADADVERAEAAEPTMEPLVLPTLLDLMAAMEDPLLPREEVVAARARLNPAPVPARLEVLRLRAAVVMAGHAAAAVLNDAEEPVLAAELLAATARVQEGPGSCALVLAAAVYRAVIDAARTAVPTRRARLLRDALVATRLVLDAVTWVDRTSAVAERILGPVLEALVVAGRSTRERERRARELLATFDELDREFNAQRRLPLGEP